MPNSDSVCGKCGRTFEVFQSMNDPRLERCIDEACGGPVKRKPGTGAGFIFKGSGFYATDYRSTSYREAAKKESSAAAATPAPATPAKKDGGSAPSGGGCCGGSCGHAA